MWSEVQTCIAGYVPRIYAIEPEVRTAGGDEQRRDQPPPEAKDESWHSRGAYQALELSLDAAPTRKGS